MTEEVPFSKLGDVEQYLSTEGDKVTVRTTQDIEPILDANARLRNDGSGGRFAGGSGGRYASVPTVLFNQWFAHWAARGVNLLDGTDESDAIIVAYLDDYDYSKLRTDR